MTEIEQRRKKENPQDFDILWICRDCSYSSIYYRDFEEHKIANDHRKVAELNLDTGKFIAQYTQKSNV